MSLPILQEQGGALSGLVRGAGLGLQQAMPTIAEMILGRQKQKQQAKLLESIFGTSQPQASFDEMLSLEQKPSQPKGFEITPEKILALEAAGEHQMASTLATIYSGQEKERAQKQKLAQEQKAGQDSFDRMAELLKSKELGLGSKVKGQVFGGKTAEAVGEFESLSGALEAMLVDRVSRGTLSNARFKYITETLLPKPNDREATIRGKLKGLARELDLDPSVLEGKVKKEVSPEKEEGFVMMQDPEGNIRKIPRNKAIEAQRAGGKLVK